MAKSIALPKRQPPLRPTSPRKRNQRHTRLLAGVIVATVLGLGLGIWALTTHVGTQPKSTALFQFRVLDNHSLAFAPGDASTLFFGHHQGLKVSHDAGLSWQDVSLPAVDAMQLDLPGGTSNRGYLAGHGVFMTTTDGGKTWRNQPNNLPDLDLHTFTGSPTDPMRLYTAPVNASGLYTSTDGGSQWTKVALPPGGQSGMALTVAPDSPLHLYAGIDTRVAESRDGGKSWFSLPGPVDPTIQLTIDPVGILYAGTTKGLAKRLPDGTWHTLALPAATAVFALSASAVQPERVAVVDQQGHFYRSDDGGQTWATR